MRIASALAVLACSLLAQSRPADLLGWTKAKWGMTDSEILKVFQGQAVLLDAPVQRRQYVDGRANVGIEKITIETVECSVQFVVNPQDGRLFRVMIKPVQANPTAVYFQQLEKALVTRYGAPDYTSSKEPMTSSRWVFPTTVIELHYSNLAAIDMRLLSLTYEVNKSKQNPL